MQFVQKEAGIPKRLIKVEEIPGLSKFPEFIVHLTYLYLGLWSFFIDNFPCS